MIKDFEYFAPRTVEEALTLLSRYKDESKVIAGGQSLLILMRQGLVTPKYLIDIKGISSLDYINFDEGNHACLAGRERLTETVVRPASSLDVILLLV